MVLYINFVHPESDAPEFVVNVSFDYIIEKAQNWVNQRCKKDANITNTINHSYEPCPICAVCFHCNAIQSNLIGYLREVISIEVANTFLDILSKTTHNIVNKM